jgi:hypothetical protein
MAYMSHYSTLTVLPAMLLAAGFQYVFHRKGGSEGRKFLLPAVVPIVPIAVLAAVYPGFVQHVLNLAIGGGGNVLGSTALSGLAGSVPVLQYMILEVYDDVAFVVLLFVAAVYLYRGVGARNALLFLPVFWLFAVLLTSPENINGWRFAFMAIVPLTLMAGPGIVNLFPSQAMVGATKKRQARTMSRSNRSRVGLIAVVLVGLLVVGSWGTTMLSDSFTGTQVNDQAQDEVYQAIQWLGVHTPSNSTYLSVSDWRFTYSDIMIGRTTTYQFLSTPDQAIPFAQKMQIPYIIVTNAVTASIPPVASLFPWNNFPTSSNSNLTLVFSNPDVRVYQLA